MSTFDGLIREISGISVDRFDGENLNSKAFFLSHCHTDHMKGLQTLTFQNYIIQTNKFLYLSAISSVILRALVPNISSQIKELPLERISTVEVENGTEISVTCIPAGHCPGSVMFLFETEKTRILYTGDYRIHASDIKLFKCFYDAFGNVKTIDKIYLDTTFFLDSHFTFPTRDESLSELCRVISSWLSQDPENCVKLDVRAKYGYEYVFREIYNTFKMPVHIDEEKFKFYSVIPEMDKCVTTSAAKTQIHNCYFEQFDVCYGCNLQKVRFIKLSAFRWANVDFKNGITEVDENGVFYICYSTHASYEEGLALLELLKPNEVHMCVERPNDPVTTLNIRKLIDAKLKSIKNANTLGTPTKNLSNKLFQVEEFKFESSFTKRTRMVSDIGSSPKKVSRTCNILDSPPR